MDINLRDVLPGLFGGRTRKRKMRVGEALDYLVQEEEQKTGGHGPGDPHRQLSAWNAAASSSSTRSTRLPDVRADTAPTSAAKAYSAISCRSSKGPTVNTRYGFVRTDHILFIAAGAFHDLKTERSNS